MNINLVPAQELVGLYDKKLMIRKIIIAAAIVLAVVMLFVVIQAVKSGSKARLVKSLEEQYARYTTLESSIKKLRKSITENKDKQKQLSSILPEQFFWSEKLLILSRLKTEDVWFNDLVLSQKNGYECKIKGYLFNLDERVRPIAQLNKYVKKIKSDEILSKAFSKIEVRDIKNEEVDNKRVLGFNLFLEHRIVIEDEEDGD